MKQKQYKFTLKSAAYSGPGINVRQPFSVTLPEDSPRINLFRNQSFEEKPVPGTGTPVNLAAASGARGAADDMTEPEGLDVLVQYGVPGNKVKLLKDTDAYEYPSDILDESETGNKDEVVEALVKIKGIADATAIIIHDACVAYMDTLDAEPETDEEDSDNDDD